MRTLFSKYNVKQRHLLLIKRRDRCGNRGETGPKENHITEDKKENHITVDAKENSINEDPKENSITEDLKENSITEDLKELVFRKN